MIKGLWARIQMRTTSDPTMNYLGTVDISLNFFIKILIYKMSIRLQTFSKLQRAAEMIVVIIHKNL